MGAAHTMHTIHTQCQYYLLLLYTSTIPYILHYLLSIYPFIVVTYTQLHNRPPMHNQHTLLQHIKYTIHSFSLYHLIL